MPATSDSPEEGGDTPPAPSPPPRQKKVAFAASASIDSADEVRVRVKHTTTKMGTSTSSHTTGDIHPYVAADLLNYHAVVPLYAWIEAVCHVSRAQLIDRMARIKTLKWFEDEVIQAALVDFASNKEKGRYTPFAKIANRILELAPGNIPGITKKSPYPIPDPHFIDNSTKPIKRIPEHGSVGAQRKPDVLCLRQSKADEISGDATARVEWTDILHWWEIKYNRLLIDNLREERLSRGMSTLRPDGQPVPSQRVSFSTVVVVQT